MEVDVRVVRCQTILQLSKTLVTTLIFNITLHFSGGSSPSTLLKGLFINKGGHFVESLYLGESYNNRLIVWAHLLRRL